MKRLLLILALAITAVVVSTCTNSGGSNTDGEIHSVNGAPTGTASPGNGSYISTASPIRITFNETMDDSSLSLSLSGAMNSGYQAFWTKSTYRDDTLYILPSDSWTSGAGTVTVNAKDSQGESLATMSLNYTIDTSVPSFSVRPGSGTYISVASSIQIVFSESMDSSSLIKSGTLLNDGNTATWSNTHSSNDTLTIAPTGSWSTGIKTLSLEASDLSGKSTSVIELSYHVHDRILYVSTVSNGGDDSNDGLSSTSPKASIQAAINASSTDPTVILVSEGTYFGNLFVHGDFYNVSLYGGYSSDFQARNPAVYVSEIRDTRTSGGASINPLKAIETYHLNTSNIIDGFTMSGGVGSYIATLYNTNSSPTIENNIIKGGSATYTSYGIYNEAASPVISGNTIKSVIGNGATGIYSATSDTNYPGIPCSPEISTNTINDIYVTGSGNAIGIGGYTVTDSSITNNTVNGGRSGGNSYGIYISGGNVTISRNRVYGGDGSNYSIGIIAGNGHTGIVENNLVDAGSSPNHSQGINASGAYTANTIRNNTINGGHGTSFAYGIYLSSGATPTLVNNLVFGSDTLTTGVYENDVTSDPVALENNAFYNVTNIYYDNDTATGFDALDGSGNPCTSASSCSTILDSPTGSDNVLIAGTGDIVTDLGFSSSSDWHLSSSSPTTLTGGANSLNSPTTDLDGSTRTVPISIGAYEYDTP